MRINQWISHNSKYSRREADLLIKEGKVFINRLQASLNSQVLDSDRIFLNGKELKPKDKYTIIAYNKPKGEIVSKRDDRGRRTIFDSLEKKYSHFIPVGRLDFASEGLILLSDSAKIANALMQSNLVRIYNLKVDGKISKDIFEAMSEGLSLENARAGGHKNSLITSMTFAPFVFFEMIKESKSGSKIKVGINEGQNRELRRFFAHFNLNVLDLKRVSYGFVNLNALPSGKSRYLDKKEYKKLREFLKQEGDNSRDFKDSRVRDSKKVESRVFKIKVESRGLDSKKQNLKQNPKPFKRVDSTKITRDTKKLDSINRKQARR